MPTIQVKKSDYHDYVVEQVMQPLMEQYGKDGFDDFNIHLLRKDWGEYLEVGSALYGGYSDFPNKELQKEFDRLLNLKVWW